MSHECMSQSGSQHDLVVLDLKPLGFQRQFTVLPQQKVNLCSIVTWGTQFYLLDKDLAGASFWAAKFSCG